MLEFTLRGQYFVDKMVPMGLKIACICWECLAKFLNWLITQRTGSDNIDYYMDEFSFGESHSDKSQLLMLEFSDMCNELGVPIAQEKMKGLLLLWYTWVSVRHHKVSNKNPWEKILRLLELIINALSHKKRTLKELQCLTGSLQFCGKAMPSARAFIRRMYASMSNVKKTHHRIHLTQGIKEDLRMWQTFLNHFSGVSYMLDVE